MSDYFGLTTDHLKRCPKCGRWRPKEDDPSMRMGIPEMGMFPDCRCEADEQTRRMIEAIERMVAEGRFPAERQAEVQALLARERGKLQRS